MCNLCSVLYRVRIVYMYYTIIAALTQFKPLLNFVSTTSKLLCLFRWYFESLSGIRVRYAHTQNWNYLPTYIWIPFEIAIIVYAFLNAYINGWWDGWVYLCGRYAIPLQSTLYYAYNIDIHSLFAIYIQINSSLF